jgi:tripartite ATP-independent transporter DctP family solute receptor
MPDITLRFGGYQTDASVHTRALRLMIASLKQRLGDAVDIELIANVAERGRKAADVVSMTADGELDLCYIQSSYVDASRAPGLRLLDLPFVFTERTGIYAKLDGAFGARLAAEVAASTPHRILAYWDNGFRHLSNRERPIRTPTDCKGLKIRTTASPLHQEIFAAFGFEPMSIDPSELAQAVATNRVDAQENPLTNLLQFGINRYHKHVSLTSHFFGCAPLLVNRARFDALPAEVRHALQDAVREATAAQRGFAQAEDVRCLEVLTGDGAAIVSPAEIDFAAFKAAVAPIIAREAAAVGPDVMAELEA